MSALDTYDTIEHNIRVTAPNHWHDAGLYEELNIFIADCETALVKAKDLAAWMRDAAEVGYSVDPA